ncbi:MAG TPA: extracellular solute-binding protein [Anaerolineae bacterium]|nr:extracellular solute-binding protein [Anaerolineae bacterium]
MTSRKSFLLLAVLAFTALLLTACPAATPAVVKEKVVVEKEVVVTATPVPKGPVTITFWHAYNEVSPENKMLVETLIPMFEASHPNIKVESQAVPYNEFRQKLLTSMAGGVAPDLIRSDIIWVPELADMGALVALDEAMPDFEDYKAKVFPGPLSTNFWQGHYYGLPLDTNTRVWFWNKEMYEAAGIPEPPKTIDDVMAQCDKIKALGEDKYVFADGGTYAWAVLPWIWSFGGAVTDPDITTATGYLNGSGTVAAYQFWLDMYKQGCLSPSVLGSGVDAGTGYAQDIYANYLDGPWMYPIYEAQFPNKQLHATLMPAGPGGSISVVGGEDIVLFQQSKHKEEAMEFIRFALSPEYQLKMAETGQLMVLTELLESDYIKNHPYYGIFLEQLKTAKARTPHPAWTKMDEIITNAGQAILREEKGVQEALDEAAAEIDALLSQ